jgi:hypothetical protein
MRVMNRTRSRRALVLGLAAALASVALAPSAASGAENTATGTSAQVALDWNSNAVDAVRAARTMDGVLAGSPPRALYQLEGLIYMSYVQAAVYDAVTKISHRYEPYHNFKARAEHASLQGAVIAAAYNTLVFYLGDPSGILSTQYSAAIAGLPAGRRTARGIAVGEAAARDIEVLRTNDGRNAPVSNACPTAAVPLTPGAWLCTPPPSLQSMQTPWIATMKPFMLRRASQFRAPSPPAVTSTQYATDFAEVKAYGAVDSAVRTSDQRDTAWFWNANVINQLNQTLRDVATQHAMNLVDTVRLLAAGVMVPTDAGIACWDSKYHYFWWRPITAIQNDGNPADLTWSPLVTTPNHMEYPSAHGCVTGAMVMVLAKLLRTTNLNVTIFGAQNGTNLLTTSRTYATVDALSTELVNARIWMGFHFRTSVVAGENLADAVAKWTLKRNFQREDD